jgi:hypothetical protein
MDNISEPTSRGRYRLDNLSETNMDIIINNSNRGLLNNENDNRKKY